MTISNPLISIIINCYNGEKYLSETLDSVLSQTYNNWEVIFWDNQSTDSSAKIYKSYKDKRFKYFYANEYTSLYKARNLAIEKSKGDFISFLDADDLWEKNKLDLQIPYFSKSEVGVVYSNLWILNQNIKSKKLLTKKKLFTGNVYNKLIVNYNVGIITAIIRKKFYLELKKKFDERFSSIGDFDFFIRISKICLFESTQLPLAYYRLHGKNRTKLFKEEQAEEFKIWIKENESDLSDFHLKKIKEKVSNIEFVNYKMDGKYKECINMLLRPKMSALNLKNLVIFFTPILLLKKLLWYHQD